MWASPPAGGSTPAPRPNLGSYRYISLNLKNQLEKPYEQLFNMELLPLVFSEKQGSVFKFWFNGKVNTGLRLRNSLFRHVQSYPNQQRDQAYALGYALAQQNIATIITCSPKNYKVWVDLKTSAGKEDLVEESVEEPLAMLLKR